MKKVALFFGGLSNEAEVSIVSAKNIVKNFDYKKHRLLLIYWDKSGNFFKVHTIDEVGNRTKMKPIGIESFSRLMDVAFLVTHGKYGEDGVLQAILESQKIAYTGCGVLSSALCMDKSVNKLMMQGVGIPQVKFLTLDYQAMGKDERKKIITQTLKKLRFPLFVKPANSGSSVGITKVLSRNFLAKAITEALKHDSKVLIEQGLESPREIEVAILGNEQLIISRSGELIPAKDFYDYEDKYVLGKSHQIVPARIPKKIAKKIRALAEQVYRICGCRGFARVDFFLNGGKVYFNEINTLPGFTDISMYPMLMKDSGIGYKELLNKIIALALSKV